MTSMRPALLALVLMGTAGLIAELLLMEHYDSWTQVIPLAVLGVGLVAEIGVAIAPTRPMVRAMQTVMGAFLLVGVTGLWLHYRGNASFEQEIAPSRTGVSLIWMALRGAVPTLAPGALIQLGALGLVWGYRHPALELGASTTEKGGV